MPANWVKLMVEEVMGSAPFKIGEIVVHPSGRKVKIISGQYWGHHGLSNHWFWREVFEDGTLGEPESGYGWQSSGQ